MHLIPLAIWKSMRHKPGSECRKSGQYVDSEGNQITMVDGRRFPPTERPRNTWRLSDESKGMRE